MLKSMFKVIFIWIQTVLLMQNIVFGRSIVFIKNNIYSSLYFKSALKILRYFYFYMKIDLIEVFFIEKIFEKLDIFDRYATIEISDQC